MDHSRQREPEVAQAFFSSSNVEHLICGYLCGRVDTNMTKGPGKEGVGIGAEFVGREHKDLLFIEEFEVGLKPVGRSRRWRDRQGFGRSPLRTSEPAPDASRLGERTSTASVQ